MIRLDKARETAEGKESDESHYVETAMDLLKPSSDYLRNLKS